MIRLLSGDCRDVLATLPADSVHCVVTSPPYFGLRDYGTALWDGGDAGCDHRVWGYAAGKPTPGGRGGSMPAQEVVQREQCGKCGARRIDRQIGLEATPEAYLQTMVAVFREVKRVLRPDGTCWVNMGDSYNANQGSGWTPTGGHNGHASPKVNSGLAAKQLLLMPARLALALQADGWWVRSDIIWHKPNPMPESCTDRPTSAHEHVFLLTRSSRYFYDADAVREPHADWRDGHNTAAPQDQSGVRKWNPGQNEYNPAGRSCRNVWTLATHPYAQAHFATFPPALAERCIRAGTSERGCCAQCGKPWTRITQRSVAFTSGSGKAGNVPNGKHAGAVQALSGDYDIRMGPSVATTTTGWQAGCTHDAAVVPCVVLDCFAGAGTTLLVADRLQRDAIGIELNVAYTQMAMDRVRADAPLLVDAPVPEPPEDARMADLFDMAAD